MIIILLILCCLYHSLYPDFHEEIIDQYKSNPDLITYVKSNYEQTMHGISYLVYPAQKPKQLWVFFNGAIPNRYTMWSWFWSADETWDDVAYLFLKDDDIRWYLGSEQEPKTEVYCDIINMVMKSFDLEPHQICTIGHSMGGYAALYYGLLLSVGGVYVFRPQVTWDAGILYYSIKKLHKIWTDITVLVERAVTIPVLYLQYGEFLPDKKAGHTLVDAYRERHGTMIVERTEHPEHVGYHPTQEQLIRTIHYMMNQ